MTATASVVSSYLMVLVGLVWVMAAESLLLLVVACCVKLVRMCKGGNEATREIPTQAGRETVRPDKDLARVE